MNDKELQQAFLQFLAKKSGAKNQLELEKYVQSLGEDGLKQAYDEFTKVMLSQAQKAAHGAKLQYFRNLKHKCGEGEELVFYKKGGSVECGCKGKVMEKGGEVKKASTGTAIDDFKKKKQLEKGVTYDPKTGKMRPATKEELEQRAKNRKDATQGKGEGNHVQPNAQNSEKVKKAGAGCIAEFKKRFAKGGSLNGIPFYLAGTPKGGLPTAPKAEDRYKDSRKNKGWGHNKDRMIFVPQGGWTQTDFVELNLNLIQGMTPGLYPANISRTIVYDNQGTPVDTSYIETPSHWFTLVQKRRATKNSNSPEYETLKRRFNTAWNLAK